MSICMLCSCMIIVVVCCSFFRGDIEFLLMAFLYLSFTAVTFHFAPPGILISEIMHKIVAHLSTLSKIMRY